MTFVVTETCIKCKLTDCVEVCPVDCFHEGPNFLVIDPDECIDCTLCEPECPVEAIYSEDELPAGQEQFLDSEQQRYKTQLEIYARAMFAMEQRPIRLGLYFPMLTQWREWEFKGASAVSVGAAPRRD